jgi:hypothetical protein
MDCAHPPDVATLAELRPYLDACEIPIGLTLSVRVEEVTPAVLRVRFVSHDACAAAPDESLRMRQLRKRAMREARAEWGAGFRVSYVTGECEDARRVEALVVERG